MRSGQLCRRDRSRPACQIAIAERGRLGGSRGITVPDSFDVAVIGGGPGGYVAAIRAAQLGGRVALAEKERLGGTCLVKGCIPTKALLQSSELYSLVAREGARFGVVAESVRFDMNAAQERRVQVVDQLVKGVEGLLKAAGVEVLRGHGRLADPG